MSGLPVTRRKPVDDAAPSPETASSVTPQPDAAPGEEGLSDLVYAQLVAMRDRLLGK